MIAVDTETYDPNLKTRGCGGVRGDGYVVGISLADETGWKEYYPIRHQGGGNLDRRNVIPFIRERLSNPDEPKVFANALYDLEWLRATGIEVAGEIIDVQVAEPLLDENALSFSLDTLAHKYLGEGKVDDMYVELAKLFGGKATRNAQIGNLWRAHASVAEKYAKADADLTLRVYKKQRVLIEEQGLMPLFRLECELLRVLLMMRFNGVRVDIDKAKKVDADISKRIVDLEKSLVGININAAASIAEYCDSKGLVYPRTPTGKPSFTAPWMATQKDVIFKNITDLRKLTKMRDTFIRGYILGGQHNGRLYCQFHSMKSDESGTVSGRLSSSSPNLQNVPSRDGEFGPLLRSMFIPNEGMKWLRIDLSQIEFRLFAHYALGKGSDSVRAAFNDDPTTDFHTWVSEISGVERKAAKSVNFAILYGSGKVTLAETLGKTIEEAERIIKTYQDALPFARGTFDRVSSTASTRGYIRTLLGRRRRFDMWEKATWGGNKDGFLPEDKAKIMWPNTAIRRAFTHKALNALLQGTAADMMKKAMVDIYKEPNLLGDDCVLHLTVHDELVFSIHPDSMYKVKIIQNLMQDAIKLRVPVLSSCEVGSDWYNVEEFNND